MRAFFKWLCKQNYLLSNPASEIELPRLEKRLPKHVLPDLSPYEFMNENSERTVNIGWLDTAHTFVQGEVAPALIGRIGKLCRNYVNLTRGYHPCELCGASAQYPITEVVDGQPVALGSAEIRVASAAGESFAAPNLILHYIVTHGYLPPPSFLGALDE